MCPRFCPLLSLVLSCDSHIYIYIFLIYIYFFTRYKTRQQTWCSLFGERIKGSWGEDAGEKGRRSSSKSRGSHKETPAPDPGLVGEGGGEGGGAWEGGSALFAIMSFDAGLQASPWERCRWACRRWAWRKTSAPDIWGRWSAVLVTAATA